MHKKSFFVPGLSSICFKVSYSVLAQKYGYRNRYLTSNNSERRSHELLLNVKCRSKKRSLFAGLTEESDKRGCACTGKEISMKEEYLLTKEELLTKYQSLEGLTDDKVDLKRKEYGENALAEKEQKSILQVFMEQLRIYWLLF